MGDGVLTFDHGRIELGGVEVDGILKTLSIRGAVRFDEAEQDGISGTVKTPMGWEDADITMTMELLTDDETDCYARLARLSELFQGYDNGGNPKVYEVVNVHALARGIRQVVFAGLESSESDMDDVMLVVMSFVEHNPPIVRVEAQAASVPVVDGDDALVADAALLDDSLTIDLS